MPIDLQSVYDQVNMAVKELKAMRSLSLLDVIPLFQNLFGHKMM